MSRKPRWHARLMPEIRRSLLESSTAEASRVLGLVRRAEVIGHVGYAQEFRQAIEAHQRFADAIRQAEMYWVAHPMTLVAMDASIDVPALSGHYAPARCGLIAFEQPLPPWDIARIGGLALRDGTRTDIEFNDPLGVDAIVWDIRSDQVYVDLLCRPGRLPFPLQEHQSRHLVPITRMQIPQPASFEALVADPAAISIMAFLMSCWTLMAAPGTAEQNPVDSRTGTAATPRTPIQQRVVVVDLRPPRTVDTSHDDSGRKLTVRHMVRGHWTHQAHGPGHSQRRLQWIDPYIKGPKDAPLITSETVYRWR